MRSVLLGLATLALAACAPPVQSAPAPGAAAGAEAMWPAGEARPTLQTDMQRYAAGASAELRLENLSNVQIGYNLCGAVIERRDGEGWAAAGPNERACTRELRLLEPGRHALYLYELPAALPNGEYRFRLGVQRMPLGDVRSVASASFHLGPQR